jgi:hypothetical protein
MTTHAKEHGSREQEPLIPWPVTPVNPHYPVSNPVIIRVLAVPDSVYRFNMRAQRCTNLPLSPFIHTGILSLALLCRGQRLIRSAHYESISAPHYLLPGPTQYRYIATRLGALALHLMSVSAYPSGEFDSVRSRQSFAWGGAALNSILAFS